MNKNIYFVLIILTLSGLAQFSLQTGMDWLQFARTEIETGQWWRFITGNLVHLTWRHWFMNAMGFLAILILYPSSMQPKAMMWVFLWCCLSVTLGIWIFNPEIYMYVGLSGALHGLLAALIVADYKMNKHILNIVLLMAVIVKLAWESIAGPLPGSESMAGGPVLVQSHLYGFIGGLLITFYIFIFNKNKKL